MADIELSVGFDQSEIDAEIKKLEREIKSVESSIKFAEQETERSIAKRKELYAEVIDGNKEAQRTYSDQLFLERQEQKQIDSLKKRLLELRETRSKAIFEPTLVQQELNANKQVEEQLKKQIKLQEQLKKQQSKKQQAIAAPSVSGLSSGLSLASKAVQGLGSAFTTVLSIVGRLASRVVGLIKNVLIFSVITMGLRELREYIGNVVSSNDQLANSLAVVKMNLATAFSAIYTAVLPALQTFIDWLGRATAFLAAFIAKIFGSSYKAAQRTAKSFNRQATATKKLTKETKKLGKELTNVLASFDELNVLSNEISDKQEQDDTPVAPIKPTTPVTPEPVMPDYSKEIERAEAFANKVKEIFGNIYTFVSTNPFVNWSISELIPHTLTLIGSAMETVKTAVDVLSEPWQKLNDEVISPFADDIGKAAIETIDGITNAFDSLTKQLKDDKADIQKVLDGVASGVGKLYRNVIRPQLSAVWGTIKETASKIWSVVLGILHDITKGFSGLIDFIDGIFSQDWEKMWKGLANFVIGIFNSLIGVGELFASFFQGIARFAIKSVNNLLKLIAKLTGQENPLAIPEFISTEKGWRIPYLAQGAVIPPNREFLAVLGDQTSGTNIETPVETMKQAFRDVMAEFGNNTGGEYTFVAQIDGREIFRETVRQNQLYKQRIGSNAFA